MLEQEIAPQTNPTVNYSLDEMPLSLAAFLQKDIPPVQYFVQDILQVKGKAMISAAPNIGKSIFVQNLALDIATYSSFLGKFVVLPAFVLYLDLEMGEAALKERFQKMLMARGLNVDNLDLYVKHIPALDLLNDENKKILESWIKELKILVLILDPLGNAWAGKENDQEQVRKLTAYLNSLIANYGISILLVHHWRKANKDYRTGGQMAAGSYVWEAWADTHITLEGDSQSVVVSCHKNRNRPKFSPFITRINPEMLHFEFVADCKPKFEESTLIEVFDSFGLERVSKPDIIKKAKDKKLCSPTTMRKLIDESKLFHIDKETKTHFLTKKGGV